MRKLDRAHWCVRYLNCHPVTFNPGRPWEPDTAKATNIYYVPPYYILWALLCFDPFPNQQGTPGDRRTHQLLCGVSLVKNRLDPFPYWWVFGPTLFGLKIQLWPFLNQWHGEEERKRWPCWLVICARLCDRRLTEGQGQNTTSHHRTAFSRSDLWHCLIWWLQLQMFVFWLRNMDLTPALTFKPTYFQSSALFPISARSIVW